jgi:hypothetical protein
MEAAPVRTILLASVTPYAGKNVVALALAQHFRDQGKSVGYFKPIGPLPTVVDGCLTDQDAVFFKQALDLQEPLDVLAPVVLNDQTITEMLHGRMDVRERIWSAYNKVKKDKDILIAVSMGRMSSGLGMGYPMSRFAIESEAKVIVVDRFHWPGEAVDGILHMKLVAGDRVIGVVFNHLSRARVNRIKEQVQPFLQANGLSLLGTIAEDKTLSAVAVSELVKALDGQVLCRDDKLDDLVENLSIGAMNIDAALRVFQRVPNKAVITGGDRADIQVAALETSTKCIILTGGMYPNERILTHAEESGVPIIMVSSDTKNTVDTCSDLFGSLSLRGETKIERIRQMAETALDWKALDARLK